MSSPVLLDSPQVIPVYLQSKGVSSWQLRKFINEVLASTEFPELLPENLRRQENLPAYGELLRLIHLPESVAEAEKGRQAMAFLEAFAFFVEVQKARELQQTQKGLPITVPVDWLKKVVESLPFTLTAGQKRVVWDALQEMDSGSLMTRLLNGDVGSGKTVVAGLLAAAIAQSGYKTIFLAPTEILAQQHARTLSEILKTAGCKIALWTASTKEAADQADIIVGTHAVLEDSFAVAKVGLVVVDEQHRFGVRQRSLLRDKQKNPPHVLAMTATPIPRTLALVLFGDLSVSVLKEKPQGRPPIMTDIIPPARRRYMEERMLEEVKAGHQVFVLCPRIVSDEVFEEGHKPAGHLTTVTEETIRLRQAFPKLRIEALHGKLKSAEKDALMTELRSGEIQILVATSVVEVGVDLPNATVMIVENAERFGLAQLHQLRGRIGRGTAESYCYLCTEIGGGLPIERLRALVQNDDGFSIAEQDLELRGPGDLTGTLQSGLPTFQLAKLTDLEFLQRVRGVVEVYAKANPDFLNSWKSAEGPTVTGLE